MRNSLSRLSAPLFAFMIALLGNAPMGSAQVEYVKVCSQFGAFFYYIPGSDVCLNSVTGEAKVQTEAGPWASFLPYPEGRWVTKNPQSDCAPGKLVPLGTFESTDFVLNPYDRKETAPVELELKPGQFISKVIMKGGFYDPRLGFQTRHGTNGSTGLCLRSKDPTVFEFSGAVDVNPPYGNGGLPIGCVANERIVGMPAAYAIPSTAAYPNIDGFLDGDGTPHGPYLYGKQLVVTTDLLGNRRLTYNDMGEPRPLAGTLSVWACVEPPGGAPPRR